MQSWLAGPLHLQAITEQKTSFAIHKDMHTHAPLSTREGWKTHRERSLSKYLSIRPMQSSIRGPMHLQQIQIENRERKREICYLQVQEAGIPPSCHILNYNSQERPRAPQNYSLWQKQACNKNNNSNINSTSRLDISWLKLHLRVSPAHVGVLTIELLFLNAIKPVITAQKLFICETRPPGAKCKTFFLSVMDAIVHSVLSSWLGQLQKYFGSWLYFYQGSSMMSLQQQKTEQNGVCWFRHFILLSLDTAKGCPPAKWAGAHQRRQKCREPADTAPLKHNQREKSPFATHGYEWIFLVLMRSSRWSGVLDPLNSHSKPMANLHSSQKSETDI